MATYGWIGFSMIQVSVRKPAPDRTWESKYPLLSVLKLSGTVISICVVNRSLGLSNVGIQCEAASVSPCVHICTGLLGIALSALMKYSPLSSLMALLPPAVTA